MSNQGKHGQSTVEKQSATSRYKGVYLDTWRDNPRWRAQIKVGGERIHLGIFDCRPDPATSIDAGEIEAAAAYDQAALKYYGASALTNFGPPQPVKIR